MDKLQKIRVKYYVIGALVFGVVFPIIFGLCFYATGDYIITAALFWVEFLCSSFIFFRFWDKEQKPLEKNVKRVKGRMTLSYFLGTYWWWLLAIALLAAFLAWLGTR